MKLNKIKVSDFKRIGRVALDLEDINILVGPNGSGKSSIIQAIHLACCVMRQADRVAESTSTVGIDELDYLPTNHYKRLGHNHSWGNMKETPSSKVSFTFGVNENIETASAELRSARNAGISITGRIPTSLSDIFRKKQNFFSAYIPGVSGIPNSEEKKSKKVILKACSYGDSNIVLRNVLLLLKETNLDNIRLLESWIGEIIGSINIEVLHDNANDLSIGCEIQIGEDSRPIELIGTGYLQLIQIFSYILLFQPGVLLIDEPDIHLHPSIQEKLVKVLARVARERELRILLTTHSPFIVRGAPSTAKVYWVQNGSIESSNRQEVELALGWGAFGKKIIIITEDEKTEFLKKIISQWPEIEKFITFYPGTGYKGLPKPQQAFEIYQALGQKFKIFIHRDRDSLTDDEVAQIQAQYAEKNTYIWFPELSDIEAYFCSLPFLTNITGENEIIAQQWIDDILTTNSSPIFDMFTSQRRSHNEELYATSGGSPNNDDVWTRFQSRELRGAKGKFVFNQLKNKTGNKLNPQNISNHHFEIEIASSLKSFLERLL